MGGATGSRGDSARKPPSSATQRTSPMEPSGNWKLYDPSMLDCPLLPWKPFAETTMPSSDSKMLRKLALLFLQMASKAAMDSPTWRDHTASNS